MKTDELKDKRKKTKAGLFIQKLVGALPQAAGLVAKFTTNPIGALTEAGQLLAGTDRSTETPEVTQLRHEYEMHQKDWELEVMRLELEEFKAETEDIQSSRSIYDLTKEIVDDLAAKVMNENHKYVGVIVCVNIVAVMLSSYFGISMAAVAIFTNLSTLYAKSLIDERQQFVQFFTGARKGDSQAAKDLQKWNAEQLPKLKQPAP